MPGVDDFTFLIPSSFLTVLILHRHKDWCFTSENVSFLVQSSVRRKNNSIKSRHRNLKSLKLVRKTEALNANFFQRASCL